MRPFGSPEYDSSCMRWSFICLSGAKYSGRCSVKTCILHSPSRSVRDWFAKSLQFAKALKGAARWYDLSLIVHKLSFAVARAWLQTWLLTVYFNEPDGSV